MKKIFVAIALLSIFGATELKAQYASEYDGGLVVKLNPEGSKYVRFIL